jgi:hypothetical protein
MALQAVLHVGLSFANVGLFDQSKLVASKRFYLPQEPLKNSLKKFWQEFGTPNSLTISSRYLERILDAKLGGSVAQVVTAGFETWPILCQPVLPDRFCLHPKRQDALASQELIFGLSERISTEGEILSPIKSEELEFILAKLKMMNVKRVCINLAHSNQNPEHQKIVTAFFQKNEFEVFSSYREKAEQDEMPAWRKNVLNACLSGAFTEHGEDIQKSFGEEVKELFWVDSFGERFTQDKNKISSSMFGWTAALHQQYKKSCDHLLYLGIENWSLISMQKNSDTWGSAWGQIEIKHPETKRLQTQPSLEIVNSLSEGLQISQNELGFEPGPISFGRAQKTMVLDILIEKFKLELPYVNAQGTKRFQDQMTAVIKNSPELSGLSVAAVADLIVEQILFRIALELQFSTSDKILVTGYFAEGIFPLLKKKFPQLKLELDSQASACAINSLANVSGIG